MKKTFKKLISLLCMFIMTTVFFLTSIYEIYASSSSPFKYIYTEDYVIIRSGPSSSSTNIAQVSWKYYEYLGETSAGNGCTAKWYRIKYSDTQEGYVCSQYATYHEITLTDYEYNQVFPESYQSLINDLKVKYPNWTFVPDFTGPEIGGIKTALNFPDVINGQNTLGKSLIETTNAGWKHLASYNYLTNTFANNYPGGGDSWYAASNEVIAYYLDPRNFLNEQRIFMFETLDSYNSAIHTEQALDKFLANTFMKGKPNKTAEDIEKNMTYAQIILKAADDHNINPYFLASRIFQEVGFNGSIIITGKYKEVYEQVLRDKEMYSDGTYKHTYWEWAKNGEYENYFNFYNIGASGSWKPGTIIGNGLKCAKIEGWDSEYDAIIGGARFVRQNYFEYGDQINLYYQKFNVVGKVSYYTNQYMQNIQAPNGEALTFYNIYNNSHLLNSTLTFKIPIYKNMPSQTQLPHPGNPNNYLSNIYINDKLITGFSPEKTEYTFYVSKATTNVNLSANPLVGTATVSGTGNISLTNDITTHNIVVTAGNLTTRNYKINFVKSDSVNMTIEDIINNIGVKYNNQYMSGIQLGTNVSNIVNNIQQYNFEAIVTIKDINGNEKNNSIFGTGDTVTISLGNETKNYSVVLYGDTNGDGQITIVDLLRVQKNILDKNSTLNEVFQKAADVNGDGSVTIMDLLRIQKHILGHGNIEQ